MLWGKATPDPCGPGSSGEFKISAEFFFYAYGSEYFIAYKNSLMVDIICSFQHLAEINKR